MSESRDVIASRLAFEIAQVDQLLTVYSDLLDSARERTPDPVELAALASVLHSFYNGIENMLLCVAKGLDGPVPTGPKWHRDLLLQMGERNDRRPAVFSPETSRKLDEYLAFRHFYRHAYSFFLDWGEVRTLVLNLGEVWMQVKSEIGAFVQALKSRPDDE